MEKEGLLLSKDRFMRECGPMTKKLERDSNIYRMETCIRDSGKMGCFMALVSSNMLTGLNMKDNGY